MRSRLIKSAVFLGATVAVLAPVGVAFSSGGGPGDGLAPQCHGETVNRGAGHRAEFIDRCEITRTITLTDNVTRAVHVSFPRTVTVKVSTTRTSTGRRTTVTAAPVTTTTTETAGNRTVTTTGPATTLTATKTGPNTTETTAVTTTLTLTTTDTTTVTVTSTETVTLVP